MASDDDVKAIVYRSCLALDDERFDDYLALYASNFNYRVTAYSPELRQEMVWLDQDREQMANLLEGVDNHHRLPGRFTRQANVYLIDREPANDHATVTTSLVVMYTDPEGVSKVFAVGRYVDSVDVSGDQPLLTSREVRLETRELGPGSHVPL